MKGEDYADLLQAKPGDKICCSMRSINGILTIKTINKIDEHVVEPGKYSKSWSFIHNWIEYEIVTDYRIIRLELKYRPSEEKPAELKVPVNDIGYILRRIPLDGKGYMLMNSTGLDTPGCKVCIESIKKIKGVKGTPKKFNDKYKFYNCKIDKLRDESNLTSHFKQELTIKKLRRISYSKGYSKEYNMRSEPEFIRKIIEFDYDPSNFIIPYEVYRLFDENQTILKLPDDVTGLGYRFFNTVDRNCKIIYPNRKLTLKKDCLKGVNYVLISEISNLNNGIDTEVKLSNDTNDMLVQIRLPILRNSSHSKGFGGDYGTKRFINPLKLKTGDIIKYPGCGKSGDVILDINSGKLVTKNYTFDCGPYGAVISAG